MLKTALSEKLSQNLRCRESLNSSGTVSRKTSTASDYTPENTYVSAHNTSESATVVSFSGVSVPLSNPPIEGTDIADSLQDELNDSLKHSCDEIKLVRGQKVDLKVFVLRSESAGEDEDLNEQDPEGKTEINESKPNVNLKLPPQRKISRFLVSPVLSGELDVPQDHGGDGEVHSTQQQQQQTDDESKVSLKVECLRKSSAPVESLSKMGVDSVCEQKMSVCSLKEEVLNKDQEAQPVCGPEMINTLEQLKISLDNLKHSSHPKKDSNEGEVVKKAGSQQTTAAMVPQQNVTVSSAQQQTVTQQPVTVTQHTQQPVTIAQQNVTVTQQTQQPAVNNQQNVPMSQSQVIVNAAQQPPVTVTAQLPITLVQQSTSLPAVPQQPLTLPQQSVIMTQQQPNLPAPQTVVNVTQQPVAINAQQPVTLTIPQQSVGVALQTISIPQQPVTIPIPPQSVAIPTQQTLPVPQQPASITQQPVTIPPQQQYVAIATQQQQSYQPSAVASPPIMLNIQEMNGAIYQQPPQMTASVSVQNLSMQAGQQPRGQFQHSISIDETLHQQGYLKKPPVDGLQQIIERFEVYINY